MAPQGVREDSVGLRAHTPEFLRSNASPKRIRKPSAVPPTTTTTDGPKGPKGHENPKKSEISGKIFDFSLKLKELGQIVVTIFSGVKKYVFWDGQTLISTKFDRIRKHFLVLKPKTITKMLGFINVLALE